MACVLDIARGYLAAGLSVIRVRANGSKAPADAGWRAYSERLPTEDELRTWFHLDTVVGIGIPGGPASGNLAVLDFETGGAWTDWFRLLSFADQQRVRSIPAAHTPRGGMHLYCRLPEPVPGVGLAYHCPDPDDFDIRTGTPRVKTLIEVRGNGEQVLAPGCPPECHPTHKLYEWLREPPRDGRHWADGRVWERVPLDVWFAWIELAESLNQVERRPTASLPDRRDRTPRPAGSVSPGDDFNARGTWEETGLYEAGWQIHRDLGDDRAFVRRPGKSASEGQSGTVGLVVSSDKGDPLFYPFTTACHPFEQKKAYSRWRVYAILKHRGDFPAAAKALAAKGYGDQTRGWLQPAAKRAASVSEPEPTDDHGPVDGPGPTTPGLPAPLPLVYYSEVQPALDAADFVEGLLIDGTMSVIYGESNCGKTFFALDLALHVAAGTAWRGREVDQRGVLYLALEGGNGFRNRVAAYKQDSLTNAVDLPFAVVPVGVNLLAPDGDTLRVIEAAKTAAARLTMPVGLIVVDTLSRAMAGGNENSSEDMGALVRNLDLIRQALPSHVAAVHHSGKDAAKGARGHSLLRAATDTEIEVTRDSTAKVSTARVTKQRDLEGGQEFAFQLHPVELGHDKRGKPVASCVVRECDATGQPNRETREIQKMQEKARLKAEFERKQDDDLDLAVLTAIREETRGGIPASMKSIRRRTKTKQRADESVARLIDSGRVVATGPFRKPSGGGAMTDVPEGYRLAENLDLLSE